MDESDLEIDVCSVDEENQKRSHNELTIVAAEAFISDPKKVKDTVSIPLREKDLLSNRKDNGLPTKERSLAKDCKKIKIESEESNLKILDQLKGKKVTDINTLKTKNEKLFMDINKRVEDEDDIFDTGVNNALNRFSFESDHLALKDNSDYHALLRTLAVLEAQQIQAIKDLERLHELKEEALSNPLKFVKNLQEKKMTEFPKRQTIVEPPIINWNHYMTAYSGESVIPQIGTRNTLKTYDKDFESSIDEDEKSQKDKSKRNEEKNPTFNRKWTAEEQQKLEKLLLMFPPEEIEARRWEKIAKALGNRTAAQVSSRIQKYFLKLAKANMPIPGRGPSLTQMHQLKKKKINPQNFKNSTFFPSWKPTVSMDDDNDDLVKTKWQLDDDMDDDDIPASLKDTPEYQELVQLKLLRKRQSQKNEEISPVVHEGFMCDGCKINPIIGVRWHCTTCISSVDFCNNCAQMGITTETHSPDHNLNPLTEIAFTQDSSDSDYRSFEQQNKIQYNYLDPNFAPRK